MMDTTKTENKTPCKAAGGDIHRADQLLIHYGELALKCRNRVWFEERLISNLRASLHGTRIRTVERQQGLVHVSFSDVYSVKDLHDKASRVFGVASFAPVVCASAQLANIEETVLCEVRGRQFRTFAVRARRADKRLPYTSREVNERVGALVRSCARLPDGQVGALVDLDNPELTIWIDILSDRSYIYLDKFKGAGGLPVGTSGRVLCLISGGIDSPVAAWRMMRRGAEVSFIHFHSHPFTDSASQEKVREIIEILSSWQCGRGRIVMIPFGDIQKKIVTGVDEKYRVILYRRFMVRIAEEIAREIGAEALVTGEALGQVASQTLSNLATVESLCGMPILRPLIGMDKQEIVDLAKKIGTYELSILPHQDCCQFLEPRHPVTGTNPGELDRVEASLDIESLVKEGLTGASFTDISSALVR